MRNCLIKCWRGKTFCHNEKKSEKIFLIKSFAGFLNVKRIDLILSARLNFFTDLEYYD